VHQKYRKIGQKFCRLASLHGAADVSYSYASSLVVPRAPKVQLHRRTGEEVGVEITSKTRDCKEKSRKHSKSEKCKSTVLSA
jgi:hypothetical protein